MAGTHGFLPEAASAQIKQELHEGLQSPKDLNTAFSPYSVWRPSRFLEAVSKEGMKASYQVAKDGGQLDRERLQMQPLPDLSGKTQEASEGSEHFGRLKGPIPVEEDAHSLEIMRQHFRHFCYKEIEGPRVVLSELQELCHQWLVPERHTKEQIVDLVILEQFLTILPLEMQIWVCKSSPATCAQALELAEGFLLRLQDCEQKGSGLLEEAFVHSPASERELSDAVEICISAEEEEEAVLMGTSAAPVAEAGTSRVETPVPGAALCGSVKSPPILQVQMPEGMVQDQAQQSKASPPRRKVPWSGFEQAFTYVRQKGKNLIVQCNYCLPAIKNVSSAITSSSNLKKHLERAHPEKLILIESAKRGRRRGYSEEPKTDDSSPAIKMLKQQQPPPQQTAVERWGCGRESVTQRILDKKIIDFIVEETLPLQIVDKPSFVRLVLLGLPKDLTIMCAATLKDRIEKRGASMRDTLANRMGAVEYIATTADCWMDGKKTFLGVTAHWISPTTLKREFAALACKRVKGSLTQPTLAKTLRDVHMQYRVHNKVASTTLDSGSNFSRALRAFRGKEPGDGSAEDDGDDSSISHGPEDARVEFVPISELLHTGIKTEKEATEDLGLPPHQRCVSHTLSLVATQDLDALISDPSENNPLGPFRKHFSSLMGKCSKLWSKQTQSAQFAQYIHQQCGVYLKVPNHDAGWNATFEALKQLSELLSAMPLKMDTLMDQCSLARITPAEGLAVQEYTEIMGPLAQSLDILQRENGMFMGYLLPTLYNLDRKLQGLENKPVRYTHCFPLLRGLREALRRRFAPIWEDRKLLLAACLHPRFKVDWLESAQMTQTNRYMMEALVKAEIRGTVGEDSEGSSEKDQEGDSLEDDFFNIRPRGRKSAVDIADEEVSDYLKCPSREVSSLHAFPRVMQTFLKYNTGLPSSAAVHRLFGTESSAVTINGFSMCDKLFEQLVLLKQNKAVF